MLYQEYNAGMIDIGSVETSSLQLEKGGNHCFSWKGFNDIKQRDEYLLALKNLGFSVFASRQKDLLSIEYHHQLPAPKIIQEQENLKSQLSSLGLRVVPIKEGDDKAVLSLGVFSSRTMALSAQQAMKIQGYQTDVIEVAKHRVTYLITAQDKGVDQGVDEFLKEALPPAKKLVGPCRK